MYNKGDRVLYRNTHFGTVTADEIDPNVGIVYVEFDKRQVMGVESARPVRTEDLVAVKDAAHEAQLSIQINRIAPSRDAYKRQQEPKVITDAEAHKTLQKMRDLAVHEHVTLKKELDNLLNWNARYPDEYIGWKVAEFQAKVEAKFMEATALAIAATKF